MAYEPHPNPQPVTISSQPISVTVGETVVSDTSRYWDAAFPLETSETVESVLAVGTVIDILSLSFAAEDTATYEIVVKSNTGGLDNAVLCKYYTKGELTVSPNVKFTVPSGSFDDLVLYVERIDGTTPSVDLSISLVYRLTAP